MSLMKASTSAALLFSAAGVLASNASAQLPNDECTGAVTVIDGANGPFTTSGATTSAPSWPCAAGGNDLWYVYTATCTGALTVETCGGSYDSALQLFDSTCAPCPNFVSGPCNDDACGLLSRVTLGVQTGAIIYIRLGGFNGATGSAPLTITCTGGGPTAPDDECTGATAVTAGLTPGLSTVGYTTSAPVWPCAGGGSDRWFTFRPGCNGSYAFTTCTAGRGYDTAMELFLGPCGPCTMTSLACNDDTGGTCGFGSTITATLTGGTTYFLRVGGYNGASGAFDLDISVSGGTGSFATAFPGCGGTAITATGSPNIGGAVNYTMTPVQGLAQMWVGLFPLNVPLCAAGCVLGCTIDTPIPGNVIAGPVPCDPTLVGGQFYVQGLDLGAAGGCTVADPLGIPLTTSNTILTTIG